MGTAHTFFRLHTCTERDCFRDRYPVLKVMWGVSDLVVLDFDDVDTAMQLAPHCAVCKKATLLNRGCFAVVQEGAAGLPIRSNPEFDVC